MLTPSDRKYLTDKDLAVRWNVSRDTIHRWKRAGKIPTPKKLGESTTRWSLDEIEQHEAKLAAA
jgi:prophage regulatory protein